MLHSARRLRIFAGLFRVSGYIILIAWILFCAFVIFSEVSDYRQVSELPNLENLVRVTVGLVVLTIIIIGIAAMMDGIAATADATAEMNQRLKKIEVALNDPIARRALVKNWKE